MTHSLCSTLRSVAARRRVIRARELSAPAFAEARDLAVLGSVSTVAVALVSALALAVLGGA